MAHRTHRAPFLHRLVQAGLSTVVGVSLGFEMHFARKLHYGENPHLKSQIGDRAGRYAAQ